MRKVIGIIFITLVSTMSFADSSGLSLDEAITALRNDIDLTRVAKAVICAEEKIDCSIPTTIYSVTSIFSQPTSYVSVAEVGVLERALLATEVYSPEELIRIQNALDVIKARYLLK